MSAHLRTHAPTVVAKWAVNMVSVEICGEVPIATTSERDVINGSIVRMSWIAIVEKRGKRITRRY